MPGLVDRLERSDGCWLWPYGKNSEGYGTVRLSDPRRMVLVHRQVFEEEVRPLEQGEQVLHHCDTPLCGRPDHLFAGTQADNMQDMAQKGRHHNQLKKVCSRCGGEFEQVKDRRRCPPCVRKSNREAVRRYRKKQAS